MKGLDTGLFLLWMVLIIHCGSCNYAEILRGQCYAFCLTRQESQQKDDVTAVTTPHMRSMDAAVRSCRKNRQCKWCLYACDRPLDHYHNYDNCVDDCETSRAGHREDRLQACTQSCGFIKRSSQSKFGKCPAPSDIEKGRNTACVQECQRDLDCDGMNKCCDNGCGNICLRPMDSDGVFPPVPKNLTFKERKDGGLIIEWTRDLGRAIIKPVIFTLRWWCPYTPDVLYEITTKARVKLKGHPSGVQPGAKCNFMVAAINIHGSEGFSPKYEYMKEFLSPSPPLNLEKSRTRLHDGKVDITMRWQPPLYTDGIPVARYVVLWSDAIPKASPNYMRLHMHKKTVDAQRTSYTIQRLEPETVYFVQVRAVVKWRDKVIQGKLTSTYIEAYSAPQPAGPDTESSPNARTQIHNITVQEPVFVNSQLRANVSWSLYPGSSVKKFMLYWMADVCDGEARHRKTRDRVSHEATTHEQQFQLFDLHSSCVYQLRIHAVNIFDKMDEGTREYFQTPPCWETKGEGLDVICPPKISPPLPPEDLSVRFKQTSSCMCQAVVSWQRSSDSDEGHRVSNFCVRWGQSRPPPGGDQGSGSLLSSTVVYNTDPYRINVPGNDSRACMTYLESNKHYTVQVISLVAKLKSPPAVLHFMTPETMPPCYGLDLQPDDEGEDVSLLEIPEVNMETTPAMMKENRASLPHSINILVLIVSILLCFVCL